MTDKELKYPKLGSKIYVLEHDFNKDERYSVKEKVITGVLLTVKDDSIRVNLDNENQFNGYPRFQLYDRNNMWFSLKKANSVCDHKNKADRNERARWKRYHEELDKLKDNLEEVENKYIGKEVLIKTATWTNSGPNVVWRVEKIKKGDFRPHVETNSYCFWKGNEYLLSKENKTWKFYTEKLKLNMQKEELEKKLKEIEEQIKEKENE